STHRGCPICARLEAVSDTCRYPTPFTYLRDATPPSPPTASSLGERVGVRGAFASACWQVSKQFRAPTGVRNRFETCESVEAPLTPTLSPNDGAVGGEGECRAPQARERRRAANHHHGRASRAAGFTLLEVLGALALLALLLMGVYGGVRSAIHGVRSGSAAIARVDQIGSAQRFLRGELAQALAQPIARTDNGRPIYFAGSAHEMRYVAPLPGYLGKLGPQLQVLKLVDDGKGGQRLELRLALLPPDGQPPKPLGEPQVLLDHIK